ncbi:hypothetical protein [Nocardioides marmoraquaticus]
MSPRVRRAARVALPLLVWVGLVAAAVTQGRALRDAEPATGSWLLLVASSLGAVAALYAALVGLLRNRVAADRDAAGPPGRSAPRHRA